MLGATHFLGINCVVFVGKSLKMISTLSAERETEIGTAKDEFRTIHIEAPDS